MDIRSRLHKILISRANRRLDQDRHQGKFGWNYTLSGGALFLRRSKTLVPCWWLGETSIFFSLSSLPMSRLPHTTVLDQPWHTTISSTFLYHEHLCNDLLVKAKPLGHRPRNARVFRFVRRISLSGHIKPHNYPSLQGHVLVASGVQGSKRTDSGGIASDQRTRRTDNTGAMRLVFRGPCRTCTNTASEILTGHVRKNPSRTSSNPRNH